MPKRALTLLLLATLFVVGCGAQNAPQSATTPQPNPTNSLFADQRQTAPTEAASITEPVAAGEIIVAADAPGRAFDRRLLGTNVPAWLGPDLLADKQFQAKTIALGTPLLRMPGGSWSNYYDWLGCELRDYERCYWHWAVRPSEFLAFARAVDAEIIWTVSMNGTAKEAAALVAFFNGDVDDERPIGIDQHGRDWKTVGHWARLRSENGSPAPLPVRLWEVGNELYGSKPETGGAECASWGWEDAWTCDGVEYITGRGEGPDRHEGFLEFREAMRAVDPSILVGAVGVEEPRSWSGWGDEVIAGAGAALDFYVIHTYPFLDETPTFDMALDKPQQLWPRIMADLTAAFARAGEGRHAPVAVTEYNLTANMDLDKNQLMPRAVNAIFTADSVGQMAEQGFAIANHWNLANGAHANGSDYGMIDVTDGSLNPMYYGLRIWHGFGSSILPVRSGFAPDTELSVYAGRTEDGALTIIAINKSGRAVPATLRLQGGAEAWAGGVDTVAADSPDAFTIRYNGQANPEGDQPDAPATPIVRFTDITSLMFEPYSINRIRLSPVD